MGFRSSTFLLGTASVVAVATLVLGTAAAAQTGRDVGVGTVPTEVWTQEGFDPAQSAGLFVGIRSFEDKSDFTEVPYAVDDAVDLAHLFAVKLGLIVPAKVVLSLAGEPQKEASKRRLSELLRAGARQKGATGATQILRGLRGQVKATGPRGLFVLAVATHGFSVEGGDFVVASDSLKSLITDTGIRLGAVFDTVATATAPRRLVLLDACRERFARSVQGDSAAAMSPSFAAEIGRASGQVVLTGATPGGFAYDDWDRGNGVFTAAVIDGLTGQAPADERGYVTVATLAEFVNDRVAEWVREHRPEHVGKSRGIERRVAGDAARLPLAVDLRRRRVVADFEFRRKTALTRLAENVDATTGPIDAKMYAVIAEKLLAADPEAPERFVLEVLAEIETLDGTKITRQSFAYFLGKNRGRFGGVEAPPPSPSPNPGVAATQTVASATPPGSPEAGQGWQEPVIGMRFRFVPRGTFQMGSPADEEGRDDDEVLHSVELTRGYWLGETEVTQTQWREVMGTDPSYFNHCGDNCPVEQVNWYDAVTFTNELSWRSGLSPCYTLGECEGTWWDRYYSCPAVVLKALSCEGYRLPTEAEWERAARADEDTPLYIGKGRHLGSEESGVGQLAWYAKNSVVEYFGGRPCYEHESKSCGTHRVAQKLPNAWMLYDMLGNVWEWVEDTDTGQDAYRAAAKDPVSQVGSVRVLRGGGWNGDARSCRAADRSATTPTFRGHYIGFRILRVYQ